MEEKIKISRILFFSIIGIYLLEIINAFPGIKERIDNFFLLNYISLFALLILLLKKKWRADIPIAGLLFFYLLLATNIIAIVRSCILAEDYLDWKKIFVQTNGGLSLLIPLSLLVGLNYQYSNRLIKTCSQILKKSPFLLLLFIGLGIGLNAYSSIAVPIIFFILLLPYIKFTEKIILFIIAALSAIADITWRANIIHIVASLSIIFYHYYLKKWVPKRMLGFSLLLISFIPLYYLYIGITTGESFFAPKKDRQYMVNETRGEDGEDLLADTRTFLYEEVLEDLSSSPYYLLFGKGAGAKYKSPFFEDSLGYTNGRDNAEVGFLNILLTTGIFGFFLQTALLFIAVYLGIFKSNNSLTTIFAIFLVSHWVILFIENSVIYGLYYYFTWLLIGLCYSKNFRKLFDDQIGRILGKGLSKI